MVGSTEEGQVVLVDVLGDVKAVGLDQLLVLRQLILVKTKEFKKTPFYPQEKRKDVYGPVEEELTVLK